MGYAFDCISDLVFVKTEVQKADIILIPGGSHQQLGKKAAELYLQGYAPYILPSGPYNPKIPEFSSEWEYLKKIGTDMGVPENIYLKEDKATHTIENGELSWKVICEDNMKVKKAIIVCKDYHSRRALLSYQAAFPNDVEFFVASVPDKRDITRENWFLDESKTKTVMGEVVKIGQYFERFIPKFRE